MGIETPHERDRTVEINLTETRHEDINWTEFA
jgi:hypothetical protein